MVKKDLLEKELQWYRDDKNIQLKPIKYDKNLLVNLFNKFNEYGMCEHSFCCYGLEKECWVELVEEGNWGLTLEKVKRNITRNIKRSRKYLYNAKKYGGNRLHIYETDEVCYLYIYLRDVKKEDYSIWFGKTSK